MATERVTGKVVDFARRNPSTGLGRKQSGSQKAIRAANGEGSDEKGSSWVAQTCGAWRRS